MDKKSETNKKARPITAPVYITIKNIGKATTSTAQAYKKNIDSVLGLLSYAFFATTINEGYTLWSGTGEGSWIKVIFYLFSAITLIVGKKRVKKGELSKFFDSTQDSNNNNLNGFFTDDDNEDAEDIVNIS